MSHNTGILKKLAEFLVFLLNLWPFIDVYASKSWVFSFPCSSFQVYFHDKVDPCHFIYDNWFNVGSINEFVKPN